MDSRRPRKARLEPAFSIISKCGGDQRVAQICGLKSRQSVYRWTLPKARKGTGGEVPMEHARALMQYARKNHLPVKETDFI